MKINLTIEGGRELAQQLERLPAALSRRVKLDALRLAAEPIREAASAMAPRGVSEPHLADNIVVGAVTEKRLEARGRETETVVEVGPAAGKGGDDFFYGYFQEFGTAHHGAHPFMRPAFDAEAQEALTILVDELWWSLRRGISGPEQFAR